MKAKLVIHIDLEEKKRVVSALSNIENFLEEIGPEKGEVAVVANSGGAGFFRKAEAGDYHEKIRKLSGKGVRFLICNNTLKKKGIDKSELVAECEIVPAGIVTLVQLQGEGYAYVKP